jgi:hypothetical protein
MLNAAPNILRRSVALLGRPVATCFQYRPAGLRQADKEQENAAQVSENEANHGCERDSASIRECVDEPNHLVRHSRLRRGLAQ